MGNNKQPDGLARRLPRYYHFLADLKRLGISRVSSRDLSMRIGNTPSQVRQDFNAFGGFGLQGYGYDVDTLYNAIAGILGLDEVQNMVIVGAGHLGQTLANHTYFEKEGFKLTGIFDIRTSIIGKTIRGISIRHMDDLASFVANNRVDIAALAIPKEQVNDVVKLVIDLKINGIWNFAPIRLNLEEGAVVENVQLSDSLMTLGFRLKEAREGQVG